jgi:hypothetical protein
VLAVQDVNILIANVETVVRLLKADDLYFWSNWSIQLQWLVTN